MIGHRGKQKKKRRRRVKDSRVDRTAQMGETQNNRTEDMLINTKKIITEVKETQGKKKGKIKLPSIIFNFQAE